MKSKRAPPILVGLPVLEVNEKQKYLSRDPADYKSAGAGTHR
jgi:hypothetical protein